MKPNSWNITELRYLHKALKEVGLNPKEKTSISSFVDAIIDDIDQCNYKTFDSLMSPGHIGKIDNEFIIESISAPSFGALYQIKDNYSSSSRVVKSLQKKLDLSHAETVKTILRDFIDERGIDVNAEVPLRDLGTEILFCFSLIERLAKEGNASTEDDPSDNEPKQDIYLGSNLDYPAENIEAPEVSEDNTDHRASETSITPNVQEMPPEIRAFAEKIRAHAFCSNHYIVSNFHNEAVLALPHIRAATEAGSIDAKLCLAVMHAEGCGVDENPQKAFELLSDMQNNDDADVQGLLGYMHYSGRGTTENKHIALDFFRKAAKMGNLFSLNILFRDAVLPHSKNGASLYLKEPFPEKKLANARKSFPIPPSETVFMLLDSTLFGSCEEGVAFGLKGVYWKNLLSNGNFISWSAISRNFNAICADGSSTVRLSKEDCILFGGAGLGSNEFIELLKSALVTYRDVGRLSGLC